MFAITSKQIKLLQLLNGNAPVIARWDHQDLRDLRFANLVVCTTARSASGKLSANNVFSISERGKRFLSEEREGC